jgi:hypothetical protein
MPSTLLVLLLLLLLLLLLCFVLQLLVKDVSSRMRLSDVEQHPWIRAHADPALLQPSS